VLAEIGQCSGSISFDKSQYFRLGILGVALILDIDFKLREQPSVADEVSIL